MSTLPWVELGVLGPLRVRRDGAPVTIPGAKPRAILTMLGLHGGSVVSADTLVELLWGEDPPRTAAKALQTHISSLRRTLGDGFVLTAGAGWSLADSEVDASRYKSAARLGRDAAAAGDISQAVARFEEALALWRGIPELPDGRRGTSEKTRWIEGHAALVEDRADALLATGRAAEIIGELEAAVGDAPLRERRWGQLMLALYRAGRQGEALGAYQRARALLADELGVDPGPDLRRLEAAIVAQDTALETPAAHHLPSMTRAVTFLLTDIEGSTAAWEADADAMAVALARHDELVEQVVTSRGGRLIKTRGEGDATFSVFERPSAAAAAAIELQEAIVHEPWTLREPMRIRVALHTGEVELRDGDYFGRAVNRAARLRSLAVGGQILCSGATAELVIDSLPDDVLLADLGMRQLKNLARPEHVFELRLETADDQPQAVSAEAPIERPSLPPVLAGPGPFVGRGSELERLFAAWQTALAGATNAVLIAGEPGVGKTRLAGEWSRQAYEQGALVIYGRCDEDLGAPYQPFAEALRSLVPCLGSGGLRGLRGVEALLPLVPGLTDVLPDLAAPTRADPDTERYALFDAVVALLGLASAGAPVILILDDLHWAAKPTLLLLRHLLRFGEHARVQVVGTYRSTDLDRSHPLAAMLADLHRDGTADRLQLGGLDEDDVTAYVAEAGYHDEELARALASVTGGNPFFLIEALRHVAESGGRWDASTLPQGVREAVSRRLSRLAPEANKALSAAAVVGSRFALELVEHVVGDDLVDAFDEACKAGIVIEEPGGCYRFNHALVRQSLLAELPSVRRMRLHQRIATTLENEPGADDELLAELAHHYFECAWAGNAAKAVEYCRRAADQAMTRLAYEGAADLYDRALHALEEIDEELPDREDQVAELLVACCEALLAAGDVASAAGAVSQLQAATVDSARLAAWATCFDGQLSMLIHPERLDEVEAAVGPAASKLAQLNDAAGEAKAHTVRAGCLARLGRIGDCEIALDDALTAARRGREHRAVNAVLAGAPLAALWGPNPVPRAGGRCLDVVRLLRITTDSPAVEATSTRCQAVLEAFRGRAAAARRMIDSARRTVTELGLRHALLEVEQFAGIVELVVDDPAAAEPHLRKAYNGFRRMGLDADTAETAALLGRTCLALDRDAEAIELCSESERLAGHALKPSIAWRTLRAHLLSRGNDHDEARRVAEAAVALAERTDLLVDHGDACASLATVLGAAGDAPGARAAAERAVGLYERKGAAALAEKARGILGADQPTAPAPPEAPPQVELGTACVRAIRRLDDAVDREAWDEVEQLFASGVSIESRRRVVGYPRVDLSPRAWIREVQRARESGMVRQGHAVVDVRGQRLALTRTEVGTADVSPGAPQDEMLRLVGLDEAGRIALLLWFDIEDIDGAVAELDAQYARFEEEQPQARRLENAATRVDDQAFALFADGRCDEIGALYADDIRLEDRRQGLRRESNDRATAVNNVRAIAALGANVTNTPLALRGDRLCLSHVRFEERDPRPDAFGVETLEITEVDTDGVMIARVVFDLDDVDAAYEELEARYLAGEAAPYSHVWQIGMETLGELNRHEPGRMIAELVYIDHRHIGFAPGDFGRAVEELWALVPDACYRTTEVYALDAHGTVVKFVIEGTDVHGNELQWPRVLLLSVGLEETRLEVYEEDGVDAAVARFEELRPQERRLENAASQVVERYMAHFAPRDWDAMAEMVADDFVGDDRRRVVNAGVRRGRHAEIANMQAIAEIGYVNMTSTPIATRGERLVLASHSFTFRDWPEALDDEMIDVVEIDSRERIVAQIAFDSNNIDAALAELDARYLAGGAAAHGNVLQPVMDTVGELNRHEPGPMLGRLVYADHRRVPFGSAEDYGRAVEELWTLVPDARYWTKAVHALGAHGLVSTLVIEGTDAHGNELQWGRTFLFLSDGPRVEVYEEDDVDAALARFEELRPQARRLENVASKVTERYMAHFASRDWDAVAKVLADDIVTDDRRRVASAGIRHGRDAEIANLRAAADVGITYFKAVVLAARGERLVLAHVSGGEGGSGEFLNEVLGVTEINSHNQIAAIVLFDLDDFEAAVADLDARYLAGEAAAHARTWSVITEGYAAQARHELPAMTPDCVTIDHRRANSLAPGEMTAYIRAGWELDQTIRTYVEVVHRLSDLGAVCTYAGHGVSREGFDAEWREVAVTTVAGDMTNRCELFNEAGLDAALARFDQLSRPAPHLENAVSRLVEQFLAHFAGRDWDALAELLADDMSSDDRRRVINAGIRLGRDGEMANWRATSDVWTNVNATVVATRGERLALLRFATSQDQPTEGFQGAALAVIEINDDNRAVATVVFDIDDFEAAIAELDARYLAGEAAAHARTWSVIVDGYAALNRHELPATAPDLVSIDHRRGTAFAPGEVIAYARAGLDPDQHIRTYVDAVHRLNDRGVVGTHVGHETSQEGFEAEWRIAVLFTVEGDLVSRFEVFDEADLDTALAKFDQLSRPERRLENAASQAAERLRRCFAARDWDGLAEILAEDILADDRRRVVGTGVRRGRQANVADIRAGAEVGAEDITSTVIATRGERIVLDRALFSASDQQPEALNSELLRIVEIDTDNRITCCLMFDLDDFDAAIAELDARYRAGEAAAHADTWSVIAGAYAALNRHEFPATTPDWVDIDHRGETAFGAGDLKAYLRAGLEPDQDINVYIEAVHRLTDLGAVFTYAAHETSHEGFDAEWRGATLMTVDGEMVNHSEVFDEADTEAALAKFDQLSRPTPRLENAASQAVELYFAHFAARDWEALAKVLADDMFTDDRRRAANAGTRHGRDAEIANMRAVADIGTTYITSVVIAARGARLILARASGGDRGPGEFLIELLCVVEINSDNQIAAIVLFELDDFDAAITELDARYVAGEAAAHAGTWSVIAGAFVAHNRREVAATTPDAVSIDHRRVAAYAPGQGIEYIRAGWDLGQNTRTYIEAVHRLDNLGAVITHAAHGTSREGFDAEWRGVQILTVDSEMVNRSEVFDEEDLDDALTRFEQLSRPTPWLENAATRVFERLMSYFAARDWDAVAQTAADNVSVDDRRRVVNAGVLHGRDAIKGAQTTADVGFTLNMLGAMATRGERLALIRVRASGRDPEAIQNDALNIVEIDADDRIAAQVVLDIEDFGAAIAELDARYLAGEAAAHARTWSVVAGGYAALNRHELPLTTPDFDNIDHRRGASFAPGDLLEYLRVGWDLDQDVHVSVEAVHRLSDLGAVVTHTACGTSREGFDAEWREIHLMTADGDMFKRSELFDEADLDAALARFDQLSRPATRLENTASQVAERFVAHFATRDWDAVGEVLADDFSNDDRRGVVGAGIRQGRDAEIVDMRAIADLGITNFTSPVVAARGERLVLVRARFSGSDQEPQAFLIEALSIVEINADERIVAIVSFDPDDIDAALAELEARYLAGEAAAHAHTWSAILGAYAAINRRELPATTADFEDEDHRRGVAFAPGDMIEYLRAGWDLDQDIHFHIEAVHRLSDLGAVVTHKGRGTSREGFDAEWREVMLFTADGDSFSRCEVFDEADVDAALARFDELHPQATRLENAASRVGERYLAHFAAGEWDGMAEILADDFCSEDRRRVVGAGVRHGRDAEIVDMRAIADLGLANVTSTAIATRGERLVLSRVRFSDRDHGPETVLTEVLIILETNAGERIVATVTFDRDEIDAAFADLDARYLAGEAAAHAQTWSAVTGVYVALNRHEQPAQTQDSVCIDHRPLVPIDTVELATWIRGVWDLTPDLSNYVETAHRLSNFGAVLASASHGTSQEGFGAEWRLIAVLMFEGDRIGRLEIFDEADIDAALARFDELHPQAPGLENAASQVSGRVWTCFAARDWDSLAELFADDIFTDDRRRVVSAGVFRGRDAQIANMRVFAEMGTNITSTVIATRGERLALTRISASSHEEFGGELLSVIEVGADDRATAGVQFDPDDFDAAFAELDARYLAGEAAAHAHTWTLVAGLYAGLNRHELPPTTPDFVDVDHRRLAPFAAGDIIEFASTAFDQIPDLSFRIEAVHRLSNLGAVVTQALRGTSREGFEAEWREIHLTTVEGDMFSRSEIFDEADIDAALARFEELHPQVPRLENAATQVNQRFWTYFATPDWDAMVELLADDISTDDRRRVVNAGVLQGRDAQIANMRALADDEAKVTVSVVATRGARLALTRFCSSNRDLQHGEFGVEMLNIVEIDADNRIAGVVSFDPDDIDAAFAELDAHYLAGEAAAHAHTWSAMMQAYAAANRHELAATSPNLINIDHRRLALIESGDLTAYLRNTFDDLTDLSTYLEAVHRLTDLGAVVTHVGTGTSQEGFDAAWRMISLIVVEDNLISRCEMFDEADLDAALARFHQLSRPAPPLENSATRVYERLQAYFAAREWAAMAEILADDHYSDDRRRAVNAGIRHGRDMQIANMQTAVGLGTTNITSTVVATRGERLALRRVRFSGRDQRPEAFHTETLGVVEIDADERIAALVTFDLDDVDAALEELDARYLAAEAAAHAHTWSVNSRLYAAFNRHELPATAPDWICIDHRPLVTIEAADWPASLGAFWDLAPDFRSYVEAVHRLSDFGAVITAAVYGTSHEGFHAEWRMIDLFTIDGDLVNRCELFDEADLDAALARFEELRPQAPRLENAASRIVERYQACFSAQDWAAMAELLADDIVVDDRRRVVNAGVRRGREVHIADTRAVVEVGAETTSASVVATRGERLALAHARAFNRGSPPGEVGAEWLGIAEIDAGERIVAIVVFDLDDIDAAYEEFDARYLAGEAAAHAHTWSVIARTYAALSRRELPPTTPDWVNFDHRRVTPTAPGHLIASLSAMWELMPEFAIRIETVHRLTDLTAVFTYAAQGTSQDGVDAEWREIAVLSVEGDRIDRCELFDEADLDAALARFEELQPQARRLDNTASQIIERYLAHFAARDWAAFAELLADDIVSDDRRRVVNAGIRRGRDVHIADNRVAVEVSAPTVSSSVIATRSQRLALAHVRIFNRGMSGEVGAEVLGIAEIDSDERIVALVTFDPDDIDAAYEELDARYLAGEAAAHARAWSVIAGTYAGFNRQELPATTPDCVNIDHRPLGRTIDASDLRESFRATWLLTPDVSAHAEAVHRLNDVGAVVTHAARGTSQEGFDAEWRMIYIATVEGDLISRYEIFDEADLDAALARFEELQPQAPRLENAATQVAERLRANFAARDWTTRAELLADDCSTDDRRRVVNAGNQHGRDADIANMRAIAAVGVANIALTTIATRGERLALSRARMSGRDQRPEAFYTETLTILEVDTNNRAAAQVVFDPDDIDAALAELDARYLAGDAAAHAHTWSVIAGICAAFNRREFPSTTPDSVYIDHRPLQTLGAVDLVTAARSIWDVAPDLSVYIDAVHRLSELGAVMTQTLKGTSQEGFDAEWRTIGIYTVEGGLMSRCEVYDESDLDAALARFEELQPQAPRLENAASQLIEQLQAHFAARNWAAIAEISSDKIFTDDRRSVVSSGFLRGRDIDIANLQATANVGVTDLTSTVIATRGGRLALARFRMSGRDQRPEAFHTEVLGIVEIDTDNRFAARILFDLDDIDTAFAELDARYVASEAAAYSHTWSVITRAYASITRRELPPTTPDWVNIDHRRGIAFAPGDMTAYIRALWDHEQDVTTYIETVHQLNDLGAVFVQALKATSQEGFEAEWRIVELMTVEGDLINRAEFFDEADLDAALAHFDELQPQPRRLENAVSQVVERFMAQFARREWDAMAGILADDFFNDDRRRVVGAGIRHGRNAEIADMRAIADLSLTNMTSTLLATRGDRLGLMRLRFSGRHQGTEAYITEFLSVVEINADERIVAVVSFDLDEIDAAYEELDARYLAAEAAAHSHTWSVIARIYAAFNRHELPAADWITIDHRRGTPFAPSNMTASIRAIWDLTPDLSIHIEAVHRLSSFGGVVTNTASGTSPEGFDAEWRMIHLLIVEGDRITRCEMFDEADFDAAVARFEELHPRTRRLENAASRAGDRFLAHFKVRDWDGMAEMWAEGFLQDDRRRVVGAGVRHGRDAQIADMRAIADLRTTYLTSTVMATRGERLALIRHRLSFRDEGQDGFLTDVLVIVEINADERFVAAVSFDAEDIDAAFAELDARYLAGEAAAHAHTWSVNSGFCAGFNRHELPATTPDWLYIDHRPLVTIEANDLSASMHAIWDLAPDISIYIETVHRLSDLGAVVTAAVYGTSQEGFNAKWRMIDLFTVEGDLISRCEIFDEADLDAALTRFDELDRPSQPLLENATTRTWERLADAFNRHDVDGFLALISADGLVDDRRRGLRASHKGTERQKAAHALFELPESWRMEIEPIAIRGQRLSLIRQSYRDTEDSDRPITAELLIVSEIGDDGLGHDFVNFDPEEIDAAFAELDARYLAGEAAAHAHTWSVIARTYAGMSRRELPPTTPDWVNVDHRRVTTTAPGHLIPSLRAIWDLMPEFAIRIETVQRLTDLGAVFTYGAQGTSQDGVDAEWREIAVVLVEGDLINHCELFDEANVDAALALFDELHPQPPRLENAASRVTNRFRAYFAARDWDAMTEMLAENFSSDDRRRIVNSGIRRGRHVGIGDLQAAVDVIDLTYLTSVVTATRGERLELISARVGNGERPEAVQFDVLQITEIDADERIATVVTFDLDDIDAAFAELDARYLAGEALPHAHTWSVIVRIYEAFNRHELYPTTRDWANADHRRGIAFAPGEMTAYIRAGRDLTPDTPIHIETVHRLSDLGVVVTQAMKGTSRDGFDAEWQEIALFTVEGDLITRCEWFDEADLTAALARFDELDRPAPTA